MRTTAHRTATFPRPARTLFAALPAAALALGVLAAIPTHAHADEGNDADHLTMAVMKTPTCGCCAVWVDLARDEGFEVEVTDTEDYAGMKAMAAVPEAMWSCHTTRIGGYTVEGHVPFAAIAKLLEEKPDIAGIAVPGMPMGSPGMGNDPDARFDVIAYGGTAEPDEVFYSAGVAKSGDAADERGFFGRLFGRG